MRPCSPCSPARTPYRDVRRWLQGAMSRSAIETAPNRVIEITVRMTIAAKMRAV